MEMKSKFALMTLVILLTFNSGISFAADQPNISIYIQEKEVGKITGLSVLPDQNEKMKIEIEAIFDSFPEKLDEILTKKDNLTGKCPYRLFWRGRTSIRGAEAGKLHLSSRLGYELYVCVPKKKIFGMSVPTNKLTFKHLSDAGMVDWTLFVNSARIDELYVSAKLTNIKGLPDWLEAIFGLHVTKHIMVNIPDLCNSCKCSDMIKGVALTFERAAFSVENEHNVKVVATFTALNNLGAVLGCIGNLKN